MMDEDHTIVWANAAASRLFGPSLVGAKCYAAYHRRDNPCESCVVKETFSDGEVHEHETEVVSADGNKRVFWCTANVAGWHPDRSPRLVVEISRDITERKQAEAALRESEDTVRALLNATTDTVVLIATDGTTLAANEALAQRLGRTVDELIGRCIYDFFPPEVARVRTAKGDQACQTGKPVRHVDERAGSYWEYNVHPLFDAEGHVDRLAIFARDITEQRRAEAALAESEARYRALFEQAPDSIVLVEAGSGKAVEFNDRAHQNLGYTRAEFQGLTVGDLEAIESPEEVVAHTRKIIRDGSDTFETKHRAKTGQIRDVLVTSRAVSIGGRDFALAIWRDMTERKRSEQAVRESEAKYRQLFATVSDAIVVFDAETLQFVDVNDAALQLYGYSKDEFLKLEHPAITVEAERSRDSIARALAGELDRIPLRYHKKKGGTVFPVEISVSEFTLQARRVLCGVIRDITERKRAEDVLRRQALVFENMFDAVIVTDTDHRITEWNPAANRIFGHTREEVFGKVTQILIGPEETTDLFGHVTEALEQDGYWSGVTPFGRKDGSQGHCESNIVVVCDEGGQVVGHIAVVHDISERVRAEQEAQRRQSELAHVVRLATMGEMATGLAHELNQPLSAILYYAHGCRRRLRAGSCDTEETLSITEKIAAQAERAAAFLDRIRAFVRKGELHLAPVDLNQVVREAASFAAHQARESGVSIDFQLATTLPPVSADMIQIEQVVLNVLRNGIEAMQASDQGQRRLTIQTSRDGDAVICSITDTGCGYTDDTAEQLFDAFFTTKSAGMGMGLAISRSIITAHGGRIWATPNPDGGTRFQFAIPISEAGATA
jgi:PAS domain S-box-containing protein